MGDDAEEWRLLPGGKYSVSSLGNVIGRINKTHPKRRQTCLMRPYFDKDGYRNVQLSGAKWRVHRLVYAAFVGPLVDGLVVCHLDGDKTNNAPGNLLQTTQRENVSHKILHGTHQVGEKHGRALYSDGLAAVVRRSIEAAPRTTSGRLKRGTTQRISLELGVPRILVMDIAANKTWRHV